MPLIRVGLMGFHSFTFLYLFLPVALAVFWLSQLLFRTQAKTASRVLILTLSLLFYLWYDPVYFLPVIALIGLNYWAVRRIMNGHHQGVYFFLAALDILVLIFFKFWEQGLIVAPDWIPVPSSLVGKMPIGISFLIFTLLAYLFDAKKQRIPSDHRVLDVFTHQLFFGKVISGPITRLEQFFNDFESRPGAGQFANGIRRFIIGFSRKVLVADTLAPTVNQIFALEVGQRSLEYAWFGLALFALQIYYDFSGYTDMAIGVGMMFGLALPENFDYPYIAKNIREFWRRWHITLSNWFRDYLFFPLERYTRKYRQWPRFLNVWIVFVLTGLWHGFTWNFLIWGLIHGIAISLENGPLGKLLARLPRPLQTVYSFTVVLFSWVFFRTDTLQNAWQYLASLVNISMPKANLPVSQFTPVETFTWMAIALGILFATPVPGMIFDKLTTALSVKKENGKARFSIGIFAQDLILAAMFLLAIVMTTGRSFVSFLYGNF